MQKAIRKAQTERKKVWFEMHSAARDDDNDGSASEGEVAKKVIKMRMIRAQQLVLNWNPSKKEKYPETGSESNRPLMHSKSTDFDYGSSASKA
jgi:hypothetical protein